MKKIILILLITVVAFTLSSKINIAFAKTSSPSANTPRNNLVEIKQSQTDIKSQKIEKVRTSIISIYEAYSKLTLRAGQLLDKLQVRIDKAKTAGNNVTAAETAMTDARAKLADANNILASLKDKKDTAIDKATFQTLRKQLQTVHKDINAVRLDGAKIISSLKGFNSASSSAVNKEK